MEIDYKKQGKRNRQKGAQFEKKVRRYLEKQGWIVSKWQNNLVVVETDIGEYNLDMVPAKPGRFRLMQTGFPDFIIYNRASALRRVLGVECKLRGYLDKQEKEKLKWYLDNQIFDKIQIAKKGKKRGEIIFSDFEYG